MPRSGVLGTYSLPPGTTPQQPNTTITSAVHNAAFDDVAQTLNTPTPIAYGGTNAATSEQALVNLGAMSSESGIENYIINPLGTINQRGYASGSATIAANQYTVDRFRIVSLGQALSWTESNNVRTFTAPAGGVEQVVEGASLVSGTYVLSWTGSATATVNGSTVANGATVSLTGGSNAIVRWSSGTFSLPKLEKGLVKTPFSARSIATERMLCSRYYRFVIFVCSTVATAGGQDLYSVVNYEPMRTVPNVTRTGGTFVNCTIPSPANASASSLQDFLRSSGAGVCFAGYTALLDAEIA